MQPSQRKTGNLLCGLHSWKTHTQMFSCCWDHVTDKLTQLSLACVIHSIYIQGWNKILKNTFQHTSYILTSDHLVESTPFIHCNCMLHKMCTGHVATVQSKVLTVRDFESNGLQRNMHWLFTVGYWKYIIKKQRPVSWWQLIATGHWWQWLTLHLITLH